MDSSAWMVLQDNLCGFWNTFMTQSSFPPIAVVVVVPSTPDPSQIQMTSFQRQISPLLNADGSLIPNPSPAQTSVTTLDYLCMINNNSAPSPAAFSWSWVQPSDVDSESGVIAISRSTFSQYLGKVILPHTEQYCMWTDVIVGTRADDSNDAIWPTGNFFTINQPNTPQTVQIGDDPVNVIDIYYSSASASDPSLHGTIFGANCTLNIVPTYACIVGIANGVITVNQQLNVDVQFNSDDLPLSLGPLDCIPGFKTNCTAYNVIVTDEYEVSVDQNGRLQIVSSGQRKVNDLSTTFTQTSLASAMCQTDQLAAQIKSRFSEPAPVDFSSIDLNGIQDFIFPGGKVFTFKSAIFSQNNDLICSLTYVDPGAAAPPTAMMQVSSTQSTT